ncbi:MAG: hypothetical protein ACJA2N_001969 [Salibacteraceae bacterium]
MGGGKQMIITLIHDNCLVVLFIVPKIAAFIKESFN